MKPRKGNQEVLKHVRRNWVHGQGVQDPERGGGSGWPTGGKKNGTERWRINHQREIVKGLYRKERVLKYPSIGKKSWPAKSLGNLKKNCEGGPTSPEVVRKEKAGRKKRTKAELQLTRIGDWGGEKNTVGGGVSGEV